jgi:hypothetical protein
VKAHIKPTASTQVSNGSVRPRAVLFLVSCALFTVVFLAGSTSANAGSVNKDVPKVIDTKAKYIFYMHGLAIEQGGERARQYKYTEILKELAKKDFVVIGEKRNSTKKGEYADKVASQVRVLLNAGVPAANITVAGHSKGGMMTLLVMPRVGEPDIAYVNFAGCGKETSGFTGYLDFAAKGARKARGRLLSAYDKSDRIAGSCKEALDVMSNAEVTERILEFGGGHELFYKPDPEWMDILVKWANREK